MERIAFDLINYEEIMERIAFEAEKFLYDYPNKALPVTALMEKHNLPKSLRYRFKKILQGKGLKLGKSYNETRGRHYEVIYID